MNKPKMNLYITNVTLDIGEGGMARNNAFWRKFQGKENFKSINVYRKKKISRIILSIRALFILLLCKGRTVFIHQNTIMYLLPGPLLNYSATRKLFHSFFSHLSRFNKLIIEINDLPHEQAIDLKLDIKRTYKILQELIFQLNQTELIFASNGLRKFALKQYNFKAKKAKVIVNGANFLKKPKKLKYEFPWQTSSKINCVYSGSLNKGRGIEELINTFKEHPSANLILIGKSGEWIKNQTLGENIFYEGSFNEIEAQIITSICDLGLIPYDPGKLYYNICFPTKVSFYLESGIRILSTPLVELCDTFKTTDMIIFSEYTKWTKLISSLKKEDCKLPRYNHEFAWDNVLLELDNL